MQLIDKHFEHLTLSLEHQNVGVGLALTQLCLQVEGKWLLVKLAEEGKRGELFFFGRPILIELVLHDAGNHGDFVSVVTVSGRLNREGESYQRR